MKNTVIIVILIFIVNITSYGQKSCTQSLLDAEKLFEQGFLEDVPSRLINCINKGFTNEEKLDAYKLIILSYLYDDRHNEAENYMAKFLKEFPEYTLTETDPDVFVYLFNQYNTEPILSFGPIFGGMISSYQCIVNNGPDDTEINRSAYSRSGIGISGGIGIYKSIANRIGADLNILYDMIKVIDDDSIYNTILNTDLAYPHSDYSISRISFPLSFSYDFYYKSFIPYVKFGAGIGIILKNNTFIINTTDPPYNEFPTKEGTDKKIGYIFYPTNWWLLGGVGVKKAISHGFLMLDIKYNFGISDLINDKTVTYKKNGEIDKTILNDWESSDVYFVQPDVFRVHNFAVTASYRYSFYNPKRKKVK